MSTILRKRTRFSLCIEIISLLNLFVPDKFSS